MNRRAKELVLRKYDDTGANTLNKHWAQIEYTAYWCIHLLIPQSGVVGVIPEGVDDVLLVKRSHLELHQVKCRDESQPPWTTAEVLPILCGQYLRRNAFEQPCQFHFVSDHVADNKTQLRSGASYGQLYRLKHLLDIQHDGETLTDEEASELYELEKEILPRIVEVMESKGEQIELDYAREMLYSTWIDTKSLYIRNRPSYDDLSNALLEALPGQPPCTMPQLHEFYSRLLLLIVGKIINGKSLEERRISRDDVLACRVEAVKLEPNLPDLDMLPGNAIIEKKVIYSGFDITIVPPFVKQMRRAQEKLRRLEALGLFEKAQDLILALITIQMESRLTISQTNPDIKIGPHILLAIQPQIPDCINQYFPNTCDLDIPFCYGLLWLSTNECTLWWHRIGG